MKAGFKILEYALASLLRRKYKNLSILCVYAFIVATLGSVLFSTQALRAEAEALLEGAPELVVQKLVGGRHDLIPVTYLDKIAPLAGVKHVQPRVWGYYYDSLYQINLTLMGVTRQMPPQVALLEGHLPNNDGDCAIGQGVAQTYGVEIGDSLVLADQQNQSRIYRVTGLFQAASNLLTNDLMLFTSDALRQFFAIPADSAIDLVVEIYNPREISTIAGKIKALLPDTRPVSRDEIQHTYASVFHWRSGVLLSIFLAALIAFAILAWDRAAGLGVDEKREIGILKALGWTTNDVLLLKFWEGCGLSFFAFILGILAAWLHVFYFGAPLLMPVLRGWSVLFPAFQLHPAVSPYQLVVLGALTIFPYLICTLVPAWQAAISDPDAIMRS
jgi:hypothetical protein